MSRPGLDRSGTAAARLRESDYRLESRRREVAGHELSAASGILQPGAVPARDSTKHRSGDRGAWRWRNGGLRAGGEERVVCMATGEAAGYQGGFSPISELEAAAEPKPPWFHRLCPRCAPNNGSVIV